MDLPLQHDDNSWARSPSSTSTAFALCVGVGGGGVRACVRACVGVCWRAGANLGSIDTVLVRGWPIFVRAVVQFLSDLQESSEALGVSYFFDHIQTVLELTPRSPRNPPLHNAVGPGRRVIALWLATISGSCAFTSA